MTTKKFILHKPNTEHAAFIADSAAIIGEVVLHKDSNVWFNVVLRADLAKIEIGEGSNIQDGTVCHVDYEKPVIVGKGVTVGHNATLHACKIGDNSLIGMGAIVLDGAEIGEECLVGAGAVVTPGKKIPPRSLVVGTPAVVVRQLKEEEVEGIKYNSLVYVELAKEYKKGGSNGKD
jgi:carbonic anhydrase/acetyltransferase-like protein (isoleucine patch superfamily)